MECSDLKFSYKLYIEPNIGAHNVLSYDGTFMYVFTSQYAHQGFYTVHIEAMIPSFQRENATFSLSIQPQALSPIITTVHSGPFFLEQWPNLTVVLGHTKILKVPSYTSIHISLQV